jgi:pimeloyl-ACP methyl ester carboxylesterase
LDEVAYNVIRIAVTPVYNGGGLTLIGHSMGGAIWPYFASRIASALNFNNTLRMISFGAPKPSDWDLQYVTRGTYCHRFFNNDDPVPLVPYDPGVFSSYFIFHGLNEMRRLGRFCQRTNGYEIAPTGFFSRANLPSAASANPGASVSAWLAAQTANQETAHSIVSYYSRLQRVANSPPVQPPVPAPTLLAQPVAITPLEERRANELAVATIVNDSYRRNQTPVRIPDNRLFRVYRSGRLYTVTFGDVEVANSMNKKRARGLARVGNDWLRRLQRQEIVATDNLAGMFAEYLAAAADPTSGIVPVLNTGEEI